MKIPIGPPYAKAMTFQSYGPQPEIAGVSVQPIRKNRSLPGSFMEFIRVTDGKVESLPVDFEVRQVSVSHAQPGRINAFHLHPKVVQDEIWCAISGDMLVWLIDVRADSPTEGARRCVVLSGEQPELLYIPAGVAHGYKSGASGATLLYVMNSQFDPADPNEGRLPWDHFGQQLWGDDRG